MIIMISVEERLKFYILNSKKENIPDAIKTGFDLPIKLNFDMYRSKFQEIHPGTQYPIDVIRYLQYKKNADMYIQCGDSPYCGNNWPVMVKTRDITKIPCRGVIANLDKIRHFGEIFTHPDPPWDSKQWHCVWRGADTGGMGTVCDLLGNMAAVLIMLDFHSSSKMLWNHPTSIARK